MLGFPRGDIVEVPIALREHGISLRTSTAADMAFLRRLYGQVRADELAVLPWLASQKEAFLDSQFALQHQHYLSHFPDACFLLVECNATPIGRFYLLKQAPEFLIIDISVAIAWQNQGIGTALMRDAQTMAQKVGAGVRLHVDQRNHGARRLYDRLGFVATHTNGPYIGMRWLAMTN